MPKVDATLTYKEIRVLEEFWLQRFHSSMTDERGNAVRWYNSVLDLLDKRGDEIVTGVLRDQEHKILQLGLSQEYMAELAATVASEHCRTEYDKAVLVLTATPEERAAALGKVLNAQKT